MRLRGDCARLYKMAEDMEVLPDSGITPGIIYISKIPPFMKPGKLKSHMEQFGKVGRVFLQPEDPLIRRKRKKAGASGRKMFTEGWVEFTDKRLAKAVVRSLNGQIIGGKKRGYYHDDLWNMKYLRKFKWGHISEKLAYERASRDQRMRNEISQAKKEANFYVDNIERSKVVAAIQKRKNKKQKKADSNSDLNEEIEHTKQALNEFRQRRVVCCSENREITDKEDKISNKVLSKVF